ncbi:hypothetical protein PENSUB_4708 [Penicillium subrubescens]|uniref:Uncharacterized protein n=1 Tax=Penicillium subrubescens TaxID=1316194 RepID=A0A1Q5UBP6_9EURO|nr:hypothetical protein PENSUB_4708 [Penicillium subrubescens]
MNISGRKIWSEPLQGFCSFNSFMTQVFVIQRCWFASDRTRLLVNFVPRWIIVFVIIALYLRLSYILLRTQRLLESSEHDTTIILSGYRIGRQNNSEHTDVQSGSYAHTSESKMATATVQRHPQSSKLKKVSAETPV